MWSDIAKKQTDNYKVYYVYIKKLIILLYVSFPINLSKTLRNDIGLQFPGYFSLLFCKLELITLAIFKLLGSIPVANDSCRCMLKVVVYHDEQL